MAPPKVLQTHLYFGRLGDLLTFGKVAQACGKEIKTAEAWAREPASNETPTGTGKCNPLDCIFRLIGLAHKEGDRVLVREIAEAVPAYVDYLDGTVIESADLDDLIGASLKEHSEAAIEALHIRSRPNYPKAMTEIVQAEIALRDLKTYVQKQMFPVRAVAAKLVEKSRDNGRVR